MKPKFLCMVLMMVMLVAFFTTEARTAEKEIKIGFITDLTGMLSVNGIPSRQGAIFAMEEIGHKVAGRPVKLIIEDEASDPAIAMDRARKLVESDKVCMLVGPYHSGCVAAVAEYAIRTQTPQIENSYGLGNDAQMKATWTWAPWGTLNSLTYPSGVYAAEKLGYKTATTMSIDYMAGREFTGGFVNAFTERGGKIIQEQWIPLGTKDIAPYITALKEADVLVPWFAGITATVGIRQIREFKVKMPVVFPQCQALAQPKQIVEIGDDIVGMIAAEAYVWTIDTPKNKKFVEAYRNRWGEVPSCAAGYAYGVMQIVFEALRKTRGDTSSKALAKALDNTNVEGFLGNYSFSDARVGVGNYFIHKAIKVGNEYKTEILAKYSVKTNKVGNKLVHSLVK
jgi:branched-chain amino acid transport system substrate-binding protein